MYSRFADCSYIEERLTCQITIKLGKLGNFIIPESPSVNISSRSWLAPHVGEGLGSPRSFEAQKSDSKERNVDIMDQDFEGDIETSGEQADERSPADDRLTIDEVAELTADKQFKLNMRNFSVDNLLAGETKPNTSQNKETALSSSKYEQKIKKRETADEDEETRTKQCPVCGKVVQTDGSLTRHLHKAHGIFKWSCDLCDEKFITKGTLENM